MTEAGGRYVILGGGPCGLAAGWELARRGLRPLVIERESLAGGLCATHAVTRDEGTWRFDLGGHRFVSNDEALTARVESLLGDDLLLQERKSVVLHEGRAFKYPLDAHNLLKNLGVRENGRALLGFALERGRHLLGGHAPDRSFEEWVVARFGRPLYDTFFGPYTKKLWGVDPREISADWAAERISLLHLGDAALRLVRLRKSEIRTYARRYRYPRLGMGQLFDVMSRDIVRLGGEVLLGSAATEIHVEGNRVRRISVRRAGEALVVPVREILSTTALPEFARQLGALGTAVAGDAASRLRFRSLVFLNLLLGRAEVSENTWMYVASGALRISRIQEPKRRSSAMAPLGRTSMMLEVPCTVGDRVWMSDVTSLRRELEPELLALGLPVHDVLHAFKVSVEHGYPIYHLDYERDRQVLLSAVEQFENVRTAGRQGLFRYVFLDAAMQMGGEAAAQMASGERSFGRIDAFGRATRVIEAGALTA